ncbi:MAG TPA: hypothetical protein VNX28_16500 [Gemmataceae bacterium]|jgi:hypothetical protein|nr:hypothetical protein [Gemmataceae bacterium]
MEFRWVALITLWTLLAGPVFDSPLNAYKSQQASSHQAARMNTPRK